MLVSGGLLLLHSSGTRLAAAYNWHPPFRAYYLVIVFFFISNVFLVFAPMIPPAPGFKPYKNLPYWVRLTAFSFCLIVLLVRTLRVADMSGRNQWQLHVFTGFSISQIGLLYWYVCFRWLPRRGGYKNVRELAVQEDGVSRNVIQKVPRDS